MSALINSADDMVQQPSPARAEEEDGFLTLTGDWPVKIDDDYDEFVRFFGYNPEHWVVVDPGKMSKWQQSARAKDGSRDMVWLYSYSGVKFRRKTGDDLLSEEQMAKAIERVQTWHEPIRRTLGTGLGAPVTYVMAQGDQQGGKSEGGGIEGLVEREEISLERTLEYIEHLKRSGVNIEAVADVATGDKIENIFGHYNSQARTVATMRDQYAYAIDSEVKRIKALADLGLPIILPRTPSNHGEHRPAVGAAPLTSESDNLDLQIAETVRRVLDESSIKDQLEWIIPHDEYMTPFVISGVNCAVTHGHKIRGAGTKAIADWVMRQRDYLSFHENFKLKVMLMGHFHHFYAEELSGTSVIMTPAMDGGSPWFQSSSGQQATSGLLGMTVGTEYPMGFSNLSAL